MMTLWLTSPERVALVQRLDALHAAAWREHDRVKQAALEVEWHKARAELTRRDRTE